MARGSSRHNGTAPEQRGMDSQAILARAEHHFTEKAASKGQNKPSHLWKPGQSGNPAGRPRAENDLRELIRPHTPALVRRLLRVARNERHRDHVKAIGMLLDRGHGLPVQAIVADVSLVDALAEIESRILEHDPTWIPSAQLTSVPHETDRRALPSPAAADRPDGAEPAASGADESGGARPLTSEIDGS
jgi:hypothetical protein